MDKYLEDNKYLFDIDLDGKLDGYEKLAAMEYLYEEANRASSGYDDDDDDLFGIDDDDDFDDDDDDFDD